MNRHRYPMKALAADYMRSAIGVLLPLALMLFTELVPLVFYGMAALALLFGVYGLRTAWRHGTVLIVDGNGVRQVGPLGGLLDREIRWSEMRDFRLRFFSTQSDRKEGWMQLILRGMKNHDPGTHVGWSRSTGSVISLDSNLPGFGDIVRRAHETAQNRGLAIDPNTAANLPSLGLGTGDPGSATADANSPS